MSKHVILVGVLMLGAAVAGLQADHSNSPRNPLAGNPDRVKVEIADLPGRARGDEKIYARTFKDGKKVRFALAMTNTSDSSVTVYRIDSFYQNRPQLFKDGQLIPHREDVVKLLEWKDKDPIGERMPTALKLEPGQRETFGMLDLSNWYSPLVPGIYQLTNHNRLVYGGQWTSDSPTITFEVSVDEH